MRILVVSSVRYRSNGISSVIRNLYANSEFSGEQITFVFPEERSEQMCGELESFGYEVLSSPDRLKDPLRYVAYLTRILRERKIQIMHIHGNSGTGAIEALAGKRANVPVIIMHAHSVSCKNQLLHRALKPVLNRMITDRFACSREAGAFLFGNRDCTVINNAFAVDQYRENQQLREKYRLEYGVSGKVVLGHVGVFNREKNQIFLIDVLAHYQKHQENAVLVLVGAGAEQENVRLRAEQLGVSDSVIFTGAKDNVSQLLNMFDCFLFPSLAEGLGIAPVEAQANGLPVLAAEGRIPRVVRVCDNFKFVPLEAGAEKWSEVLLAMPLCRQENGAEQVKAAGFDLTEEVKRMKQLFLSMCEARSSECK